MRVETSFLETSLKREIVVVCCNIKILNSAAFHSFWLSQIMKDTLILSFVLNEKLVFFSFILAFHPSTFYLHSRSSLHSFACVFSSHLTMAK